MFDQTTQIEPNYENTNAVSSLLASPNKGKLVKFPVRNANDTNGDIFLFTGLIFKITAHESKQNECEVFYIDAQEKYYKGRFTCLLSADQVSSLIADSFGV